MTVFGAYNGFTITAFTAAIGPEGVAPYFNTSINPQTYYIGFHAVSQAGAGELDLDDIKLMENPTPPPKISYGDTPDFITDPSIPITFSGVYKKTGLLSKTYTVTNATGEYNSPAGDMLWDVDGSAAYIHTLKAGAFTQTRTMVFNK